MLPDSPGGGLTPLPPPPPIQYVQNAPLGGRAPEPTVEAPESDRKALVLSAILLVLSIAAGAASLMPWRDFGRQFGQQVVETGWQGPGGTLGRGWVAVVIAVAVAVAGVLVASGRVQIGRKVAVAAGLGLVAVAVGEWAFGAGSLRVGPGAGLWVLLVVGVLVVITVGALSDHPQDATANE